MGALVKLPSFAECCCPWHSTEAPTVKLVRGCLQEGGWLERCGRRCQHGPLPVYCTVLARPRPRPHPPALPPLARPSIPLVSVALVTHAPRGALCGQGFLCSRGIWGARVTQIWTSCKHAKRHACPFRRPRGFSGCAVSQRISSLLQGISTLLQGISALLQGINALLQGISTLLQGIGTLLQGISALLQGISALLQGISTLLQGISTRR